MNKFLLYSLFIIKFLFGLGLIIWTIMMTMSSDVGEDVDNAFLSTYHNVDRQFNDMVISNAKFENKYDIKFSFNDKIVSGLIVKDVFLSQRVIKKRTNNKNLLKLGKNNLKYVVTSKDGQNISNVKLNMLVTMTTNHIYDKTLNFDNKTLESFEIAKQGYWNITGIIEIGEDKGYFFIKTNAK